MPLSTTHLLRLSFASTAIVVFFTWVLGVQCLGPENFLQVLEDQEEGCKNNETYNTRLICSHSLHSTGNSNFRERRDGKLGLVDYVQRAIQLNESDYKDFGNIDYAEEYNPEGVSSTVKVLSRLALTSLCLIHL